MIDEFSAYDVHAYDTASVCTEFWSASSHRRVLLLHTPHGRLRQRKRDTGMAYNETFGPR